MGSASRNQLSPLSRQIEREGSQFEFRQAMRILKLIARKAARGTTPSRPARLPASTDSLRNVTFRTTPSLAFAPSEISRVERPEDESSPSAEESFEVTSQFWGLIGPGGVLPEHYTGTVAHRIHHSTNDHTLHHFLDLINHFSLRLLSDATGKYSLPLTVETSDDPSTNKFEQALLSLVGLGLPSLRNRLATDDATAVYYSGFFSHQPRNAVNLAALLSDYFGLAISVRQFVGTWLHLAPSQQSRLTRGRKNNAANQLGVSFIAGQRVWDVQSRIRIRIGPVGYSEFLRFIPSHNSFRKLTHLVRLYIGAEFDFDVQVVLSAPEIPMCRLGGGPAEQQPRLGWNTWLNSASAPADSQDAVFRPESETRQ